MPNEIEYKGTPGIRKIVTRESPKQILSEDFPKHDWPVSGGWGYTQDNAAVINVDHSAEGVALEYKFLEYRTYEEAIIFRPKGSQLAGIRFDNKKQSIIFGSGGRQYDLVTMTVSAYTEDDYCFLKQDFDNHDGYKNDDEGFLKHLKQAESKRIRYEIEGWFDITNFFGK